MEQLKKVLKLVRRFGIGFGVILVVIPILLLPLIITSFFFMDEANRGNCGNWQEISLCDTGNSKKDLANETAITDRTSEQWKLFNEGKYGTVSHDRWGLAYIEEGGIKWYCNAFGTYYTQHIGEKFRVTLESGETIYVITCDVKADAHTHAGNNNSSTACVSGDGSMMEFYGYVSSQTIPMLNAQGFYSLNTNFDDEHKWEGAVVKVEKMNDGNACDVGGVLSEEGVMVNFSSKYYTYASDGVNGNPCVCDAYNITAYPFGDCNPPTSVTGGFNKMICSSYAAGRYWDVNYHDSNFPLPYNWDVILTLNRRAPGNGRFSRDVNNPIPCSIVSISFGTVLHDAFIEGVGDDGSVVISECNATTDNEYGFRVRRFNSLQDFLNSYGATLNGMYGK